MKIFKISLYDIIIAIVCVCIVVFMGIAVTDASATDETSYVLKYSSGNSKYIKDITVTSIDTENSPEVIYHLANGSVIRIGEGIAVYEHTDGVVETYSEFAIVKK